MAQGLNGKPRLKFAEVVLQKPRFPPFSRGPEAFITLLFHQVFTVRVRENLLRTRFDKSPMFG